MSIAWVMSPLPRGVSLPVKYCRPDRVPLDMCFKPVQLILVRESLTIVGILFGPLYLLRAMDPIKGISPTTRTHPQKGCVLMITGGEAYAGTTDFQPTVQLFSTISSIPSINFGMKMIKPHGPLFHPVGSQLPALLPCLRKLIPVRELFLVSGILPGMSKNPVT